MITSVVRRLVASSRFALKRLANVVPSLSLKQVFADAIQAAGVAVAARGRNQWKAPGPKNPDALA